MEYWGVEVKTGQTFDVKLGEGKILHLSQACLEHVYWCHSVCLHININGKKLLLAKLHYEKMPQYKFDLVFDQDFQLSHTWEAGSVFFHGYIADQPIYDASCNEEEDIVQLPISNGKQDSESEVKIVEPKKDDSESEVKIVETEKHDSDSNKKNGEQKVKIVEPKKDDSNSMLLPLLVLIVLLLFFVIGSMVVIFALFCFVLLKQGA
ncbi:histone deacetylase HDT2-like [Bidens hawaiensis]|uniref:histone deacetylase HDT2-like n=1 Tax=Bidens hawaiensis TaxID=980011 RepID=UPI00404B0CBA